MQMISLCAIDLGFDPRTHDMPCELRTGIKAIAYEIKGIRTIAHGTDQEIALQLSQAGYKISFINKNKEIKI